MFGPLFALSGRTGPLVTASFVIDENGMPVVYLRIANFAFYELNAEAWPCSSDQLLLQPVL
jgi:hypothetical protein